ncbi:MAG TPA: capsular biosynthesis protein [Elusimicrobia bacterium]|nr:capsular biosynthesis protein [Elusimicrobiota bacterium]HBT60840.1 capsular biosynthesis protein [Elusimicrobiota bacterium]
MTPIPLLLALLAPFPARAQQTSTPATPQAPAVLDSPEAAEAEVAPSSAPVILTAVGDIRLDGPVGWIMAERGPRAPFSALGKELDADILFGNLECPLSKRGRKTEGKTWTFRALPRSLTALKAAGFNLVNIANNHVMDYGPDAFEDTLKALREHDLPFIGGGRNRDEAEDLRLITVRGLRVGFLGFTSTFPEKAWATARRPGVAYSDFARVGAVISQARARCDVLVVSFHGGTELAEEPNDIQKAFCRLAVASGADLVLGHHPHVIQPLELIQGKPVLHSLGNFLFVSPNPATRPTIMARIALSGQGVKSIDFVPLDTNWGRPAPASAENRQLLMTALDRYGVLTAQPDRFRVLAQ